MALLSQLMDGSDRQFLELSLRLARSNALLQGKGWAAPETVAALTAAKQLLDAGVGTDLQRFSVRFGLCFAGSIAARMEPALTSRARWRIRRHRQGDRAEARRRGLRAHFQRRRKAGSRRADDRRPRRGLIRLAGGLRGRRPLNRRCLGALELRKRRGRLLLSDPNRPEHRADSRLCVGALEATTALPAITWLQGIQSSITPANSSGSRTIVCCPIVGRGRGGRVDALAGARGPRTKQIG